MLDQRRLPDEEVELRLRDRGRGRGGDPHARDPRRARDRRRRGVRLRAGGGAWGGPRRGLRRARLARGRQPSTCGGRSTRCATTRRPSAPARSTRLRSSAAGGWPHMPPSWSPPGSRVLTHCNTGSARDGRLRQRAGSDPRGVGAGARRARLGRRDAPAPPGRPPDRVGARRARHPVRGRRGLRRGVADGRGRGRLRLHRRRPDRRERRHANKIGTYALAVAAHHHGIPLYVVAPTSTLDPDVRRPGRRSRSRSATRPRFRRAFPARNPAFDVTPAALITAIVTEAACTGSVRGVLPKAVHA